MTPLKHVNDCIRAVTSHSYLSRENYEKREHALMELSQLLWQYKAEDFNDFDLASLYMLASYAEPTPWARKVKAAVHELYCKSLATLGTFDSVETTRESCFKVNRELRIGILFNSFEPTHVMYRDFNRALRVLSESYHTIGFWIYPPDENTSFICRENYNLIEQNAPTLAHIDSAAHQIARANLDVLIFPDVAMHSLTIALSDVRMARHQIALTGTPSPLFSREIDYYLFEKIYQHNIYDLPEWVELLPDDGFSIESPLCPPLSRPELGNARLKIAIPGTLHKIGFPFLEAVERIRAELDAEVTLVTNFLGHRNDEVLADLRGIVKDAKIISHATGKAWHEALSFFDLALMPWSFAGINTISDALAQGLPAVTLRTKEVSSIPALQAIRLTVPALEPYLCGLTPADYIVKAVRIGSDKLLLRDIRESLFEQFAADQVGKLRLFSNPATGLRNWIRDLLDNNGSFGG